MITTKGLYQLRTKVILIQANLNYGLAKIQRDLASNLYIRSLEKLTFNRILRQLEQEADQLY